MRDAATDRAFVAHLNIADQAGCIGKRGQASLDDVRSLNTEVRRQSAASDLVGVFLDVGKLGYSTNVDQKFRCGQAKLHHRNQAVTSSHDFGSTRVFL